MGFPSSLLVHVRWRMIFDEHFPIHDPHAGEAGSFLDRVDRILNPNANTSDNREFP